MVVDFQLQEVSEQGPVALTPFHQWVFPGGAIWTQFYRQTGKYLLRFPGLADFHVSEDGGQVVCRPAAGVSAQTVLHLYENQVVPLALSLLGALVFHASAVEVDGYGIAFVGESGHGKSTLAASFSTNGFRFLSDDGFIVEEAGDGYRVLPSHPSIRLWGDSEKALMGHGVKLAPPVQYSPKARFLADDRVVFCAEPQPLQRVYFLGEGKAPKIGFQRMSASEALIELVKHSFLLDIEARDLIAAHFDRVAKLAAQPVHYRLDYPRRFEQLALVRQAIVDHTCEAKEAA